MSESTIMIGVFEDDSGMQSFLQTLLQSQGYQTEFWAAGATGLRWLQQQKTDLILLDLGLQDQDGISVLRTLRASSQVPVIVISARQQEQDKVTALDLGANDYVTKPFSAGELLARIRVALRAPHPTTTQSTAAMEHFSFGDIKVDVSRRHVSRAGQPLHLTKIEFELLLCLLRHEGAALTHNQILQQVWGNTYQDRPELVRVHIGQLRQKLETTAELPRHIKTEAGVGYRFVCE